MLPPLSRSAGQRVFNLELGRLSVSGFQDGIDQAGYVAPVGDLNTGALALDRSRDRNPGRQRFARNRVDEGGIRIAEFALEALGKCRHFRTEVGPFAFLDHSIARQEHHALDRRG